MTKQDLIEMLEDVEDDAEVMIAYQPNWPMETRTMYGVFTSEDGKRVYIAQAGDNTYLDGGVAEQLGW